MRTSKKYLKITLNILGTIAFILFCCYGIPWLVKFFMPFVIALIIAWMANPLVKFAESKLKLKRKFGSIVVIVLALAVVGLIIYAVISLAVYEISGLAENLPKWWENVSNSVSSVVNTSKNKWNAAYTSLPTNVREWLDNAIDGTAGEFRDWTSGISNGFANAAKETASHMALTLVSCIMCLIGSYFFVAERDNLAGLSSRILPQGIKKRLDVVTGTLKDAVGGYFKAQFKIMGFVYLVLLVGLLILRVRYALIIGLLIALLDFLPFFGTGAVMWPWAVICLIQKDYKMGIGLFVVWALSQLVRQLVQPKMLSTSVGLPPIPTLILLYVGFRLKGALGLIFAVPIGMIVVNLYRAGMFSNFIYSIRILIKDFATTRRFSAVELETEGIKDSLPQDILDD